MPQLRWVLVAAIVFGIAVVTWRLLRDPTRDRDPDVRATMTTGSGSAPAPPVVEPDRGSSASIASGSASHVGMPAEARPELAAALAADRLADAIELCTVAATRAAHRGDCTIAACRDHREAIARSWFAEVADDDRPRVTEACEAVQVTLERRHPHRARKGEID